MAGRRLELGFEGGNILRVSLEDAQVSALTTALEDATRWHQITAEEGDFWVKLGDLQFVRIPDDGPHGVGFSRA
jgi:hypothetical protein